MNAPCRLSWARRSPEEFSAGQTDSIVSTVLVQAAQVSELEPYRTSSPCSAVACVEIAFTLRPDSTTPTLWFWKHVDAQWAGRAGASDHDMHAFHADVRHHGALARYRPKVSNSPWRDGPWGQACTMKTSPHPTSHEVPCQQSRRCQSLP